MKWCYLTTYPYAGGQTADDPYKVPVPCSQRLYDLCPKDGTSYTILAPQTENGYTNSADLLDHIADPTVGIGWNPFGYDDFSVNPEMAADDVFGDVIKEMMLSYHEHGAKVNLEYVNALVGYIGIIGRNWWNTNNPTGTCGFFEWPVPYFGSSTLSAYSLPDPPNPEDEQHVKYDFTIYPEAMIKGGQYDMDAMAHVENANPEVKWDVYIHIDIWYDYDLVNYNMSITMSASQRDYGSFYGWIQGGVDTGNVYDSDDPNNTDPNRTNEGGNGDGDGGPGDIINPPVLPDTDMTAAGSIRIYRMDNAMIKLLFDYLHSTDPAAAIVKWWTNPIQGMVSLHYLPYPLQLKGTTPTYEYIKICGMESTVQAYPAEQFQSINFGWCYCGTNRNNYLDRAPYTRVQIYLPGIGIRDINTDDVMGKYVWVQYNCDNVSGQCVAFVSVSSAQNGNNKTVKYSFSGSLAAPFPISQTNWGNTYIAAATLAAGALAGGISTAANAAAASAGGGEMVAASGETAQMINAGAVAKNVTNIGNSISQLAKPSITRSGTISGTTSLFSIRKPYLIIERPNVQDFDNFNKLKGYACGMTLKLGSLSGYTEVEKIHLTGIPATAPELSEIETLLQSGVIL